MVVVDSYNYSNCDCCGKPVYTLSKNETHTGNPHFCKGIKVTSGNKKKKKQVTFKENEFLKRKTAL